MSFLRPGSCFSHRPIDACLVEENQPAGIKPLLALLKLLTPFDHVFFVLLDCLEGFFLDVKFILAKVLPIDDRVTFARHRLL